MPLPILVVGGLTVWVVGLAVVDGVLGGLRERRRRSRGPVPCNPSISWAEVDAAIEQGCAAIDSAEWYGRIVGSAGRED